MLRLLQNKWLQRPSPANHQDPLGDLLRRSQSGDRAALKTLLQELSPAMIRAVRRVLGSNRSDLEDATQEAIIALIRSLPDFREESRINHFANRIATLSAISWIRQKSAIKRGENLRAHCEVDSLVDDAESPEQSLHLSQSAERARELLSILPHEQAEAFGLHCIAGYTAQEIADIHQVPLETVRSRLKAARRSLRQHVCDQGLSLEIIEA